jgi:hypothetical protein
MPGGSSAYKGIGATGSPHGYHGKMNTPTEQKAGGNSPNPGYNPISPAYQANSPSSMHQQ